MARATWNGAVVAESDEYESVESNVYFPPEAVDESLLEEAEGTSHCPWKGEAAYYDLVVDGQRHESAAWSYPDPKEEASHIEDYVAFWKGVDVEE